jgi:hypothetical protein
MSATEKIKFTDMLEETSEKAKYLVNFCDNELILKDMVETILRHEYEEENTSTITLYVNRVDCDGDNVSRVIKYKRNELGHFQIYLGSVFLTEYGHRSAYCSTCEVLYKDDSVVYYITLDEPTPFTKEPSETKVEDTAETLVGDDWTVEENIEEFAVPNKATILKQFIIKFLTKMDDVAIQRRGDVKPQTPWESYLLARDDMMSAILEILLEG